MRAKRTSDHGTRAFLEITLKSRRVFSVDLQTADGAGASLPEFREALALARATVGEPLTK